MDTQKRQVEIRMAEIRMAELQTEDNKEQMRVTSRSKLHHSKINLL